MGKTSANPFRRRIVECALVLATILILLVPAVWIGPASTHGLSKPNLATAKPVSVSFSNVVSVASARPSSGSGPNISSFTVNPIALPLGARVAIWVQVNDTAGVLSYAYSGLPSGCVSRNWSEFTCIPAVEGSFTITVYTNDTVRNSANATAALTVTAPHMPSITSFIINPTTITVITTATMTVTASGGTGSLTYTYTGLPHGCVSVSLAILSCTPNAAGSFIIRVFVNDTVNHSATATTSLNVTAQSTSTGGGSSPLSTSSLIVIGVVIVVVAVLAIVLLLQRKRKTQAVPPSSAQGADPPKDVA